MREHEASPMSPEQLEALRQHWQPLGVLPADYAAKVLVVAKRRQRARRVALSALLALLAAVPFVWSLQDRPEVVAAASTPEPHPAVAPTEVAAVVPPLVVGPEVAEGGLLPQVVVPEEAELALEREPDLVAEAVAMRPERAAKSRRHYRDSFRELGEDYDGLADIYFDEAAP